MSVLVVSQGAERLRPTGVLGGAPVVCSILFPCCLPCFGEPVLCEKISRESQLIRRPSLGRKWDPYT